MSKRTSLVAFLMITVGVFALCTLILVAFDMVPTAPAAPPLEHEALSALSLNTPKEIEEPTDTVPVRISIPTIGVDSVIVTPDSTDVAVLDRALLTGAVHYPSSVAAGQKGTMLIFGHSSYLPVVKNKAFQAFNELGTLKAGEIITIYTTSHAFDYRVRAVSLARAEDTTIHFASEESLLTLATCNTFGSKEERWVATATYAGKRSLPSVQ